MPEWANRFDEADQHRDDGYVLVHGGVDRGPVGLHATACDVQPGDHLDRGTSSHSVEACLLWSAELAGALGDVRHDRARSAIELVAHTPTTRWEFCADAIAELEGVECVVVDVQLLVVEGHAHLFAGNRQGLRVDFIRLP
jgi:hypothetical protein